MAKFGYTLYGVRRYGELEGNQVYYTAGLRAFAYDYGKVYVSWDSINVDPNDPNPTYWKLIRSQNGVPDNPDIGTVLIGGEIASFNVAFTDFGANEVADQEVYYSIWLFNGLDWINCGSSTAFVMSQTDTLTQITRRLPAAWLNETSGVGDATGAVDSSNQLVQWLGALTYEYDRLRLQTSLLAGMSDYTKLPKALLPIAVLNIDMPYEPTLGDYAHRSLYRVGHIVNATKGTSRGITTFSSALTHWGSQVLRGTNILLDYDDSSFEESTGRWAATGATLVRKTYEDSLVDVGVELVAPMTPLSNALFPVRAVAFGLATSLTTSGITLKLGTTEPRMYGVPVKEDYKYAVKGWGIALDTAASGTLKVTWYTGTGVALSTFDTASINIGTSWSNFGQYVTAPAGAVYAGIELAIASAATGKRFALDKFQFSPAAYADQYQDARTAFVELDADRTNYLPNPGFDNGVSGWYAKNGTVTQDLNAPSETRIFGSSVARLDATGSDAALVSEWIPVKSGTSLTFSAYVSATAGRTAVVTVEYCTAQSAAEQATIFDDEDGQYFPTNPEVIVSDPFTLGTATRVNLSTQTPAFVADNGQAQAKVSISFPDSVSGDEIYIDACLLEAHPSVRPFFQGNGAPAPVDPINDPFIALNDCRWEWRVQTNMVNNPNFDNVTGWTGNSGTTLSSVATGGGYSPFAGARMMKVNRTAAGTAKASTTVQADSMDRLAGGEDIVVTARVIGYTGDVTIDIDGANAKTFKITADNHDDWTTIDTGFTTAPDQQTFVINISAAQAAAGAYYVDAVQAEYGRVAGPFVDVADATVTNRPNNGDAAKVVWQVFGPQTGGGGRSYYWARYYNKYERLKDTLQAIVPLGSSWALSSGEATPAARDTTNSLVLSSSFEGGLAGWAGDDASLTRQISRGSLYSEYGASGTAWANVTATAAGAYGLYSDPVRVLTNAGYYCSAAVRPTAGSEGTFVLTVRWLDAAGDLLWDISESVEVTHSDRWTYIALTDKNIHRVSDVVASAAKAQVTIHCDPATAGIGNTFSVDRVIFRQ